MAIVEMAIVEMALKNGGVASAGLERGAWRRLCMKDELRGDSFCELFSANVICSLVMQGELVRNISRVWLHVRAAQSG